MYLIILLYGYVHQKNVHNFAAKVQIISFVCNVEILFCRKFIDMKQESPKTAKFSDFLMVCKLLFRLGFFHAINGLSISSGGLSISSGGFSSGLCSTLFGQFLR